MKLPSHGTVVAYFALLVALGGTSYAAVTLDGANLEKKSVTGRAIKLNSVKGNRLKTNSVLGKQINEATLACALIPGCGGSGGGAQGPPGPPGSPGTNGTNGTNGTDGQLVDAVVTATTGASPLAGTQVLTNWTTQITTGAGFQPVSGLFTAPQTGKYLISVSSNQTVSSAVTTMSNSTPTLDLRKSSGMSGSVVGQASFPKINVNIALVLNLNAPTVGEATITGIYALTAGDVVSVAVTNPATATQYDGNLTIARLATS